MCIRQNFSKFIIIFLFFLYIIFISLSPFLFFKLQQSFFFLGKIRLSPFYLLYQFQFSSLSIKPNKCPLTSIGNVQITTHLFIFLLNPNEIYVKCLKYPQFYPTQPNSPNPNPFNPLIPTYYPTKSNLTQNSLT